MLKRQRAVRKQGQGQRELSPMEVDSPPPPPAKTQSNAAASSSSSKKAKEKEKDGGGGFFPSQPQPQYSNSSDGGVDGSWVFRDDQDLVEKTVENFRHQRISMVQSLRQYVLCYESVMEWIVEQHYGAKG